MLMGNESRAFLNTTNNIFSFPVLINFSFSLGWFLLLCYFNYVLLFIVNDRPFSCYNMQLLEIVNQLCSMHSISDITKHWRQVWYLRWISFRYCLVHLSNLKKMFTWSICVFFTSFSLYLVFLCGRGTVVSILYCQCLSYCHETSSLVTN